MSPETSPRLSWDPLPCPGELWRRVGSTVLQGILLVLPEDHFPSWLVFPGEMSLHEWSVVQSLPGILLKRTWGSQDTSTGAWWWGGRGRRF